MSQHASTPQIDVQAVCANVRCVRCGHQLRGLPAGANCPECGLETATSLSGQPLASEPASWVARVRRGQTLIMLGLPLIWLPPAWLLLVWGCWLVTSPPEHGAFIAPRRWERPLLLSSLLILIPAGVMAALNYDQWHSDLLQTDDRSIGPYLAGIGILLAMCSFALGRITGWIKSTRMKLVRGLATAGSLAAATTLAGAVGIWGLSDELTDLGDFCMLLGIVAAVLTIIPMWSAVVLAQMWTHAALDAAIANKSLGRQWLRPEPGARRLLRANYPAP
ncbi:MAG: hypothetical protein KDA32_11675 [Phycisphaerales bacterium]|nr:hypothetical protein [Phycisphaerales bacterium]